MAWSSSLPFSACLVKSWIWSFTLLWVTTLRVMDRQNVLIRLSPVPTSLLWLPAEQLVWPVAYSRVHLQQHSKCYDRSITHLHQQRLPPQPLCASWMRCCLHMSLRLHGRSWWITPTTLLSHIQHAKVILCLPNSMCGIHPVFHISTLEPSTPNEFLNWTETLPPPIIIDGEMEF